MTFTKKKLFVIELGVTNWKAKCIQIRKNQAYESILNAVHWMQKILNSLR